MFIHSLSSPPLLLSISYPPLRIALCMFTCILNILTHNFKHKTFARRQLSTSFSSVCIYSPHLHVALSATLKHKAYLLFIKDPRLVTSLYITFPDINHCTTPTIIIASFIHLLSWCFHITLSWSCMHSFLNHK